MQGLDDRHTVEQGYLRRINILGRLGNGGDAKAVLEYGDEIYERRGAKQDRSSRRV